MCCPNVCGESTSNPNLCDVGGVKGSLLDAASGLSFPLPTTGRRSELAFACLCEIEIEEPVFSEDAFKLLSSIGCWASADHFAEEERRLPANFEEASVPVRECGEPDAREAAEEERCLGEPNTDADTPVTAGDWD